MPRKKKTTSEKVGLEMVVLGSLIGVLLAYAVGFAVASGYEIARESFTKEAIFVVSCLALYPLLYVLFFILNNLDDLWLKGERDFNKKLKAHFVRTHKCPAIGFAFVVVGFLLYALLLGLILYLSIGS